MNSRLYFRSPLISGCAVPLDSSQSPLEKPFPSLSVAPRISNCSGQYLSRKLIGTPIMQLHFVFNKDARISFASSDCKSVSIVWVIRYVAVESDDFKLLGAVFVEEADGDSHNAVTSCVW